MLIEIDSRELAPARINIRERIESDVMQLGGFACSIHDNLESCTSLRAICTDPPLVDGAHLRYEPLLGRKTDCLRLRVHTCNMNQMVANPARLGPEVSP